MSETFVATFVVVFTSMGRMMSGYSSVRSTARDGCISSVEDHLNEIVSDTRWINTLRSLTTIYGI
jgi:hypothetical protein